MGLARSPTTALLLMLLPTPGACLAVMPLAPAAMRTAHSPSLAPGRRASAPRATLLPADPALAAATGSMSAFAPSLLLAGEDTFGEVFLAGMSIAFAAIGTTVFVGILVNGKYDDIEKSFFDAQDDAVAEATAKNDVQRSQVVSDFFGDVNPTEDSPKPDDP